MRLTSVARAKGELSLVLPFVRAALMLSAVMSLDIYLVMGSVLIGSILLLIGNLLADIGLTFVDPRIELTRLGEKS